MIEIFRSVAFIWHYRRHYNARDSQTLESFKISFHHTDRVGISIQFAAQTTFYAEQKAKNRFAILSSLLICPIMFLQTGIRNNANVLGKY